MNKSKKPSIPITCFGRTQTMKQWAAEFGISIDTLRNRTSQLYWDFEKALTTPIMVSKRNKSAGSQKKKACEHEWAMRKYNGIQYKCLKCKKSVREIPDSDICEHEPIGWRIDAGGYHFKCKKCEVHLRTESLP